MSTFYIAPAFSNQAGQCRIVRHDRRIKNPARHHREHQEEWKEAGLMSSQGRLVCLEASAMMAKIFREREPLAAGLVVYEGCP
ncbi:hypothetical protein A5904_14800 (plasmid) [Acidithiobacillus caldus]|uniref:Uncharacterized protein n=1 Tax=Acidithiobacillus caldus (strain SM-1) TaxID=990288 RepID=F9ZU83_ACICS|nr:hypothetical protein [Acidithiobacillus caldus]AEK59702.1 conserved hypothetical protein [Acidithiobacillus caldus SM-1]AUW34207.1 hypothetical protein A5904_14800 [Acidithiobacillus caldus]QER45484.1 hypothetical protein F0726_02429 [Acidithiobacillus caldus]